MTRPSLAGIEPLSATPWTFQPWGGQNQNGDYAESILFDAHGEALNYGLPNADGALIAAAPDLLAAVRDVLALHEPYTIWAYDDVNGVWIYDEHGERVVMAVACRECTPAASIDLLDDCEWTLDSPIVEHPCPTVRAVTAHIDTTPKEN